MHQILRFREAMEMKELNQDRRSPSVSTLKYEMNSDRLTSSKRHGWAPAKNPSDAQGQRPLSFAGRKYRVAIGVDRCWIGYFLVEGISIYSLGLILSISYHSLYVRIINGRFI